MLMDRKELHQKACGLPLLPGVYIVKDRAGEVIYVGKAKRLRIRVSGYFREGADHQPKVEKMVENAFDFDVIVTDSEFEALVLECSLIKRHMPKYNILLKDDKGFCYIEITKEEYPRINCVFRPAGHARYIGPFMSAFGVRQLIETANGAFGLPTCQLRLPEDIGKTRPCLNAHIGLCCAPCSGRVSHEEYMERLEGAVALITKGADAVIGNLRQKMLLASEGMEYEKAARYRDSIAAIERMNNRQKVVARSAQEKTDAFAFAANESCVCAVVLKYRNGNLIDKDERIIQDTTDIAAAREEVLTHYYIDAQDLPKRILVDDDFESRSLLEQYIEQKLGQKVAIEVAKRADSAAIIQMAYTNASDSLRRRFSRRTREQTDLAELAGLLGLPEPPAIIESYDISNYGAEAVAGMVVFANGKPRKSDYRRFQIKTVDGPDDYAAMREVLLRRIARYDDCMTGGSFARKPSLILLDGGKGHLSVILEAVAGTSFADVPVFGLVKDDKHRTRGIVGPGGELSMSMHRGAYRFVSAIQEEVHRYSIDYSRRVHSRNATRSSLLRISGVGEATAKRLLTRFKTVDAISKAGIEELSECGISEKTARSIYSYFHEGETE